LGREAKSEVLLTSGLRAALARLHPDPPAEAFDQDAEALSRDRTAMAPAQANQENYDLLKNGVKVKVPDPDGDGETVETVRVIDWGDSANNDYQLVNQFWVTGDLYTRRGDLVGFVNGIPLVLLDSYYGGGRGIHATAP